MSAGLMGAGAGGARWAARGRAVARAGIAVVNRPLARQRLRRAVAARTGPVRIEVGAWRTIRPGWISTDVSWHARHWLDVTEPWPVPPGSVSHVFGDNVIEHLTVEGARAFLRNAHRAMRSGGRIRLTSPDAEAYARMYLDRGQLLDQHVDRSVRSGYAVDHDVSLLRTVFVECGHRDGFVWDRRSLTAELENAGFTAVCRCEVGTSDDPDLAGLEWRTAPSDRALQLVLEAVRP